MKFFTSDTHFWHRNIIKYCDRPFADVEAMNAALIENWNSVVGPDDTVYHLGDVALGPWTEWGETLTQLNGTKVLIIGNHDRVFAGEKEKMRERFTPLYREWFSGGVYDFAALTLANGEAALLSHFPYEADHMEKARHMEHRLPDEGNLLTHGHTHLNQIVSYSKKGTLQIHVGQDAWNYTPVSEDQIVALLEGIE